MVKLTSGLELAILRGVDPMSGASRNPGSATPVFSTPVVSVNLPDAEDLNAELSAAILMRARGCSGLVRSNVGGWHSEQDLLNWPETCIARLRSELEAHARDLLQLSITEAGYGESHSLTLVAWANVIEDGGYHSVHDHPAAHWSGVYYVATGRPADGHPLNGRLELLDPRTGINMVPLPNSAFATRCIIDPEPGRMLFFPSWLKHVVHPFRGTGERISISYNMTITLDQA